MEQKVKKVTIEHREMGNIVVAAKTEAKNVSLVISILTLWLERLANRAGKRCRNTDANKFVNWVFHCNLGIRDLIEIDTLSDVPVRAMCIEDSGSLAARV